MKKKKIRRIDLPEGRCYLLGSTPEEYKFLPSVTSILSLKESGYLTDLIAQMGKEEFDKLSERSALRGTAMHLFLENFMICMKHEGDTDKCLLYTQRKSTDELLHEMEKDRVDIGRGLFYNVYHSNVTDRIKQILFTEQFFYSEKYLFAGTADFGFIDHDDYIVIADFKSANSPRPEEIIAKYRIQVAAYALAFEEVYQKPVQRGEIWIAYKDGLQEVRVEGSELEAAKLEFIELAEKFHSMWDNAPFKKHVSSDI